MYAAYCTLGVTWFQARARKSQLSAAFSAQFLRVTKQYEAYEGNRESQFVAILFSARGKQAIEAYEGNKESQLVAALPPGGSRWFEAREGKNNSLQ